MRIQDQITQKIAAEFDPAMLDVINESHHHAVPKGSESHFKVVIVSDAFAGMTRIARHRAVHRLLKDELASAVHALTLHLFDPAEWARRGGQVANSPNCMGGSKTKQEQ